MMHTFIFFVKGPWVCVQIKYKSAIFFLLLYLTKRKLRIYWDCWKSDMSFSASLMGAQKIIPTFWSFKKFVFTEFFEGTTYVEI